MTPLEFTLRLGTAFGLGTIVGLERQWRQRMAGLRTNALVATGACLFVSISSLVPSGGNETQIAAYVVSGVGFLAGAVIFREGLSVSGLNTAATLWCSAAIGTLSGMGAFAESAVGTLFVLAANVVLRPVSRRINRAASAGDEVLSTFRIDVGCAEEAEPLVRAALTDAIRAQRLRLLSVGREDGDRGTIEIDASVAAQGNAERRLERVVAALAVHEAIHSASWTQVRLDEESAAVAEAAE